MDHRHEVGGSITIIIKGVADLGNSVGEDDIATVSSECGTEAVIHVRTDEGRRGRATCSRAKAGVAEKDVRVTRSDSWNEVSSSGRECNIPAVRTDGNIGGILIRLRPVAGN